MKQKFDIVIPAGQKRERLDVYLTSHVENATRTKVQEAIRNGEVVIDGKSVKASHAIIPGEVIHVELSKPEPPEVLPEDIPLTIVYEDNYLLVVNKPAGMVTIRRTKIIPARSSTRCSIIPNPSRSRIRCVRALFIGWIKIHQDCSSLRKMRRRTKNFRGNSPTRRRKENTGRLFRVCSNLRKE